MEEKDNSVGKPEEEESGQPELREFTPEELKKVLEEHEKWLVSEGKEGTKAFLVKANLQKADLREANLQGADLGEANLQEAFLMKANLQKADLREANLQGVTLWGANLQKAFLRRANLQKAYLVEANLKEAFLQGANLNEASLYRANLELADLNVANLQGADLEAANLKKASLWRANLKNSILRETSLLEAVLQDANLSETTGLLGPQLGCANFSGAKLPAAILEFGALGYIDQLTNYARKIYFAMLLACAYAWLTIASTTDPVLLTNSPSRVLPNVPTAIPTVAFYISAPLVLLFLYIYFHVYMQRLWEALSSLPAIFPDGRTLEQTANPWLLNGIVRAHISQLKEDRPPLSYLQEGTAIALVWQFIPLTLVLFWLRYLPRRDWSGTSLHIMVLVMAIWAGVMFYRLAVATLRSDESELSLWKKPFKGVKTYKRGVLAVMLGLILLLLSLGTINGTPGFQSSNVRTWVPYAFECFGFSPFANFREKDISTKPSNWSGKEDEIPLVKGAPLRRMNLRYVDGDGAFLVNADLRGADLEGGILYGANLRGANLEEAYLGGANLQKAFLKGANLQKAYLWDANLQKAGGLTVEQLSKVKTLYKAKLDPELMEQVKKDYSHLLEEPKPEK